MNKNSVELIGHYGSDEVIACSAWTSTSREITEEKRQRIPTLIEMLWSNGHETPFEKGHVHFLVNCDIASHIHLLKHRISSVNAESARYKELKEDKTYIPNDWKGARVLSLLGADPSMTWDRLLKIYTDLGNAYYHACVKDLEPLLGRKRAKESARFFKMYNSQINSNKMMSFDGFVQIYKKRNLLSPSQREIANVVEQMLDEIKSIPNNPFEYSLKAFNL